MGGQIDQVCRAGRFTGPLLPSHQETMAVPKILGSAPRVAGIQAEESVGGTREVPLGV